MQAPDLPPAVPPMSRSGSQTQAETQVPLEVGAEDFDKDANLKRKTTALSEEASRKAKKVKVSIGPAVDLGD